MLFRSGNGCFGATLGKGTDEMNVNFDTRVFGVMLSVCLFCFVALKLCHLFWLVVENRIKFTIFSVNPGLDAWALSNPYSHESMAFMTNSQSYET